MVSPAVRIKNSAGVFFMGPGLAVDAKSLVPCMLPSWESSLILTLPGNGSVAVGSSTALISHPSSLETRNYVKSSFLK
jgi:hypothetical protein